MTKGKKTKVVGFVGPVAQLQAAGCIRGMSSRRPSIKMAFGLKKRVLRHSKGFSRIYLKSDVWQPDVVITASAVKAGFNVSVSHGVVSIGTRGTAVLRSIDVQTSDVEGKPVDVAYLIAVYGRLA